MVVHNVARRAATDGEPADDGGWRVDGSDAAHVPRPRRLRRRQGRPTSTSGRCGPVPRPGSARSTRSSAGCCRRSARSAARPGRRRRAPAAPHRDRRRAGHGRRPPQPPRPGQAVRRRRHVAHARSTTRSRRDWRKPLLFVVLDELNKYAPREGESPIKEILLDVAERGRSLGIILIGAQQTASEVERRIIAQLVDPRRRPARPGRGGAARVRLPAGRAPEAGGDREAGHDVREAAGDPGAARRRVPVPGVGDAPVGERRHEPGRDRRGRDPRRSLRRAARPAAERPTDEDPAHLRLARRQDAAGRVAPRRAPRRARRDRRRSRPRSGSTSSSSPATCSSRRRRRPRRSGVVWDALLALRGDGRARRRHRRQPRQPVRARGRSRRCSPRPASRVLGHAARPEPAASSSSPPTPASARASSLLPFCSQRYAVRTEQTAWSATRPQAARLYAERMRALIAAAERGLPPPTRSTSSPRTAWCGAARSAAASATRRLIVDYWVDGRAFPASANYVALGHLHRTQRMPRRRADLVLGFADPGRLRRGATTRSTCWSSSADGGSPARRRRPRRADEPVDAAHGRAARSPSSTSWRRASATRGCGSSSASRRAPASPTTCARCSRVRSTCGSQSMSPTAPRHCDGMRPRAAARPHELFAEYLGERGDRRPARRAAVRPAARRRHRRGAGLMRPVAPARRRASASSASPSTSTSTASTSSRSSARPASGKSTVIDAICFALYGSVPRYDDERLVAPRRQHRRQEAKVSLDVRPSASDRYVATRVVRVRAGKASTPEAILERLEADGKVAQVLAGSAREMKPRRRGAARPAVRALHDAASCCRRASSPGSCTTSPAKRQDLLIAAARPRRLRRASASAPGSTRPRPSRRSRSTSGSGPGLADATEAARAAAEARRAAPARAASRPRRSAPAATDGARRDDRGGRRTRCAAPPRSSPSSTRSPVPREVTKLTASAEAATAKARGDERRNRRGAGRADRARRGRRRACRTGSSSSAAPRRAREPRPRSPTAIDAATARRKPKPPRPPSKLPRPRNGPTPIAATPRSRSNGRATRTPRTRWPTHLVAGEPCPVCEQVVDEVPKRKRPAAAAAKAEAAARRQPRETARERPPSRSNRRRGRMPMPRRPAGSSRSAGPPTRCSPPTSRTRTRSRPSSARVDEIGRAHTAARTREREARAAEAAAETERLARRDAELHAPTPRVRGATRRVRPRRASSRPPANRTSRPTWTALGEWAEDSARRGTGARRAAAAAVGRRRLARSAPRRSARCATARSALGVDRPRRGSRRRCATRCSKHGRDARNELRRIDEALDQAAKLDEEIAGRARGPRRRRPAGRRLPVRPLREVGARRSARRARRRRVRALFELSVGPVLAAIERRRRVPRRRPSQRRRDPVGAHALGRRDVPGVARARARALRPARRARRRRAARSSTRSSSTRASAPSTPTRSRRSRPRSRRSARRGRMVGIVTHVPELAERVPVRYRVRRTDRGASGRHGRTREVHRRSVGSRLRRPASSRS